MNKHIGCYGPRIDPYTFAICLTFITFHDLYVNKYMQDSVIPELVAGL